MQRQLLHLTVLAKTAFDVTINYTPVADAPADVTACDSYTLPALAVGTTLAHQTELEQLL